MSLQSYSLTGSKPNPDKDMTTLFLLLAQYKGITIVPVEQVCRDFFPHMTPEKFVRKVNEGQLAIPMIRIEPSQKAAKGVYLQDLADYIDARRMAALKEYRALHE